LWLGIERRFRADARSLLSVGPRSMPIAICEINGRKKEMRPHSGRMRRIERKHGAHRLRRASCAHRTLANTASRHDSFACGPRNEGGNLVHFQRNSMPRTTLLLTLSALLLAPAMGRAQRIDDDAHDRAVEQLDRWREAQRGSLRGESQARPASSAAAYGDAGCGLGSLVFGNQAGVVQVLAATTNGTSASQTFGITSGTSNCAPVAFAEGTKVFVEANREVVAKEISRGSGESIGALAVINGCRDVRGVGAALQREFASIFPSEQATSAQVTAGILRTLYADPALGCGKG
jgi:hypothetical protein